MEKMEQKSKFIEILKWQSVEVIVYYVLKCNPNFSLVRRSQVKASV